MLLSKALPVPQVPGPAPGLLLLKTKQPLLRCFHLFNLYFLIDYSTFFFFFFCFVTFHIYWNFISEPCGLKFFKYLTRYMCVDVVTCLCPLGYTDFKAVKLVQPTALF